MNGHAVGILAGLELGDASHPTGGYDLAGLGGMRAKFGVFWRSFFESGHGRP